MIVGGCLLDSGVYWAFAWAKSPWTIWSLFVIYGFYYGLTEGGERALIADLVPSHLRGTAYGLYSFSIGVSAFPASLIMGFL